MDSPVRKMLKKNDYNRHKLLRKIKRKREAEKEQEQHAAEKELKRRLRKPKYDSGKNPYEYNFDKSAFDENDNLKPELEVTTPDVVVSAKNLDPTKLWRENHQKAMFELYGNGYDPESMTFNSFDVNTIPGSFFNILGLNPSYDRQFMPIDQRNYLQSEIGPDGRRYPGHGALQEAPLEMYALPFAPALRQIIANPVKKGTNLIVPRVAGTIGSYAENRSGLFFKNIADFAEDVYNATSSKNLGRFYRYRDTNPRVEGDAFGDYVAEGSERTVFNDARNPDAVLKVEEGNFYPSRPWQIQNRIKYDPILTPEHVEGYVKNMTGRKGYMRTTSLAKVKTFDPDSDTWIEQLKWMDKNKDRIIKKFQDSGWSVYLDDSGSIAYARKGNKILNDIAPYNIGENNVGDIEFFDLNLLDYNPKLMSKNSATIAPIMK